MKIISDTTKNVIIMTSTGTGELQKEESLRSHDVSCQFKILIPPGISSNLSIILCHCTHLGTPPKFNIAPEKWWLEDYFPIGKVTFQGLC